MEYTIDIIITRGPSLASVLRHAIATYHNSTIMQRKLRRMMRTW